MTFHAVAAPPDRLSRCLSALRQVAVLAAAAALLAGLAGPVQAGLRDEVDVSDDAIGAPGEWGLKLHANTTPAGRRQPAYDGEAVPHHQWRFSAELSRGLSDTVEASLHLPLVREASDRWSLAGAHLQLLWLPLQVQDGQGPFAGLSVELLRLARRFDAAQGGLALQGLGGWRAPQWLLAGNATLGWGVWPGQRGGRPALELAAKAMRSLGNDLALGLEHHASPGPLGRPLPWREQDHTLYLAADLRREAWALNLGLGRGLTDASDRWTLKAVLDLPF